MSHSSTSDVVPFVLACVAESQFGDDEISMIISPEYWMEEHSTEEQLEKFETTGDCDIGLVRGWKLVEICATLGKRGRLYGNKFEKDGNVVFVTNESQYCNVGEYEMSVCADDRGSLEAFRSDFISAFSTYGQRAKIEENDSVQNWG